MSALEARFRLPLGHFLLDVAFAAPGRGVTALFGRSGTGKTTTLRCMAGLVRAPEGTMRLGGACWQDSGRGVFLPAHRRPVGYVFQEPRLFPHLTVRSNLDYGWKRVPPADRRVSREDTVALMGVTPLLDRDPAGLSGGERQRVAIARALLTSPALLLMDEPLAGLDAASRAEILPYLERLHEELAIPVIYVSHVLDEVARLADHVVLLEAGRVRGSGPLAEVSTRLDLPLARAPDAEAVLETTVARHDEAFHLTHLAFAGGELAVARVARPVGARQRVRVQARDVSLTTARQTGTSILNILPARVTDVAADGPAQVLVRLDAGGAPLLARITRRSAHLLDIAPQRSLYAQVKTVTLLD